MRLVERQLKRVHNARRLPTRGRELAEAEDRRKWLLNWLRTSRASTFRGSHRPENDAGRLMVEPLFHRGRSGGQYVNKGSEGTAWHIGIFTPRSSRSVKRGRSRRNCL